MPTTEPNCPARLARFRLECGENVTAAPLTPLPCIESIERPGRCVHCFQAIERAAGAPHGPYCTGDSRCRECARLLREARPAAPSPAADRDVERDAELDAELIDQWRRDAAKWPELEGYPEFTETLRSVPRVASARILTLIAALTDARRATLSSASELEQRLEAIRAELARLVELQNALVPEGLRRRPFSSTPVVIETDASCPVCEGRHRAGCRFAPQQADGFKPPR